VITPFPSRCLPPVAGREVSQWGRGARRGSEAPELMSPKGEIQSERAERRVERKRGSNPRHPPWQGGPRSGLARRRSHDQFVCTSRGKPWSRRTQVRKPFSVTGP